MVPSEPYHPTLEDILAFLRYEHIRATYGAVAEVIQVKPNEVGHLIGVRRKEVCWVVNARTGLPTGYRESLLDPNLREKDEIIRTDADLEQRVKHWKGSL